MLAVLASVLDQEKLFRSWDAPLVGLAAAGFTIGVLGHLFGSRTVVAMGIVMVFAAVIAFPIVLYVRGMQ